MSFFIIIVKTVEGETRARRGDSILDIFSFIELNDSSYS